MSAGSSAPGPGAPSPVPARTPKGMHDVLWPESARWEGTVARFAALVESAGYGLTITPILEHAGVFLRGIGEGSEVVGKEMYVFEDRDGQMMALRPEGTAPIARAYVQHHPVPPWKAWYVAPSFRHENPQHGRYRQHHQLGRGGARPGRCRPRRRGRRTGPRLLRRTGPAPGHLEAALHGRQRLQTRLRGVVERLPRRAGRPAVPCAPGAASREPAAGARLQVGGVPGRHRGRPPLPRPPVRRLSRPTSPGCAPASTRWASTYTIDHRLVRGFDYYTRTTFEFAADALDAAQNGIGGGGRYDGLVELLGGDPTPGIGFGIGIERVLLACDAEGVFTTESVLAARPLARVRHRHGRRRIRGRHHGRAASGRPAGRPGLRRALHEVPDQVGRSFGCPGGARGRSPGSGGGNRRPAALAQRRAQRSVAAGCHCGGGQGLPGRGGAA